MILIKIAWRNLQRHKARNLLVGSTIVLCGLIFFVCLAFTDGIIYHMIQASLAVESGAVKITYKDIPELDDPILFKEIHNRILNYLINSKEVDSFRERFSFDGFLINRNGKNLRLEFQGINSKKESALKNYLEFNQGNFIYQEKRNGIIVSEVAKEKLGINLGDPLTLVLTTWGNRINAIDLEVEGIFKSIAPWTDYTAYLNIENITDLYGSEIANQYLIDLSNPNQAIQVVHILKKVFNDLPLSISDFKTTASFLFSIANTNRISLLIFIIFLNFIISMGIANLMIINIRQRESEIGTLLAIGYKSGQLFFMFMFEILFLAGISILFSYILGASVCSIFAKSGIPLSGMARNAFGLAVLKPIIRPYQFLVVGVVVVGSTGFGAIWPSYKTSKQDPAIILRRI